MIRTKIESIISETHQRYIKERRYVQSVPKTEKTRLLHWLEFEKYIYQNYLLLKTAMPDLYNQILKYTLENYDIKPIVYIDPFGQGFNTSGTRYDLSENFGEKEYIYYIGVTSKCFEQLNEKDIICLISHKLSVLKDDTASIIPSEVANGEDLDRHLSEHEIVSIINAHAATFAADRNLLINNLDFEDIINLFIKIHANTTFSCFAQQFDWKHYIDESYQIFNDKMISEIRLSSTPSWYMRIVALNEYNSLLEESKKTETALTQIDKFMHSIYREYALSENVNLEIFQDL